MSRKPEYVLNQVFELAIPLVLSQGFRGCSMETLINTTEFNRRAFYLEFTNKQGFIDALLKYYIMHHLLPLQAELNPKQDIPQAIIKYFEAYQKKISTQGCLLVRLILELGNENQSIKQQARQYYDNLQLVFFSCIEKALMRHELPMTTNVESLALKLNCFAQGFAVSNILQQNNSDVMILIKSLFAENR